MRVLAYSALADLVPLYPLYALLFADHGLTGAQIGSLFVVWSAAGLVLEVPSGALADVVSRRLLLCVGSLLHAAAFGIWVLAPGYWVFALGFVLWAAGSSVQSGTWEALVYDELAASGSESRYQRLSAQAEVAAITAQLVGTAAAWPLFALGGYPAVSLVSVLTAVAAALVALTFPRQPRTSSAGGLREWATMLRTGLREAAQVRTVRRLVLLGGLIPAFGVLDEFYPLLAEDTGAPTSLVPLLIVVVVLGQLAGGASAGLPLRGRTVGVVVAAGALAIVAGALSGSPWGMLLVAVGYGAWQHAVVVADARLQAAVQGPARATVTSVAGFGSGVASIVLYLPWAVAVGPLGDGPAVALTALPLVLLGGLAMAWLGNPSRDPSRVRVE